MASTILFLRNAACAAALTFLLPACGRTDEASVTPSSGGSVIGKVIRFNPGGKSESYRISGWSKTEPEFTWSEGNSARLALPIGKNSGALTVRVTAAGLTGGEDLAFQPVEVFANNQKVADWQVGTTAEFNAPIPADLANSAEMLNVEFRIPKATSPKALGQNEDARILGIAVHSVAVMQAP